MSRPITAARLAAAGVVMLLAGIQIGTWLADWFDDRVASTLSLLIGVAILAFGVGIIAVPLARR